MIIVVSGIRVEVPVTSNYEFRESLMKDNLLFVAFELKDREEFPIGSYVEVDNILTYYNSDKVLTSPDGKFW